MMQCKHRNPRFNSWHRSDSIPRLAIICIIQVGSLLGTVLVLGRVVMNQIERSGMRCVACCADATRRLSRRSFSQPKAVAAPAEAIAEAIAVEAAADGDAEAAQAEAESSRRSRRSASGSARSPSRKRSSSKRSRHDDDQVAEEADREAHADGVELEAREH